MTIPVDKVNKQRRKIFISPFVPKLKSITRSQKDRTSEVKSMTIADHFSNPGSIKFKTVKSRRYNPTRVAVIKLKMLCQGGTEARI